MKSEKTIVLVLVILAATAISLTSVFMALKSNYENSFSVTGTGTVYARADIANIQIGLKSKAFKTATEATKESAEKMNKINAELKKLGIEDKDIKTSNYILQPVYNWTSARGQELVGYEINQTLNIKVRDLDKIGDVIAKTTEQGANQIGNINFTIDDEYELKNQARELAITQAKEKAQLIAAQSGMKLGKIKSGYEEMYPTECPDYSYNYKMSYDLAASDGLAAPQIQAGQNEIKINFTLIYEIK